MLAHGRLRAFIFLVCCCPLSLVGPGTSAQTVDDWTAEHFGRAMQAQRSSDFAAAEQEYTLIISRRPRFAGAYLNLGIIYHQQRKYLQAVRVLKTAAELQPELLGAQLFLGIDQYLTGDFDIAHEHLQRALAQNSQDRFAGLYLALDYLALDQPFKAISVLRSAAKTYPHDLEIAYHLAEAHLEAAQQGTAQLHQLEERSSALVFWAFSIAATQRGDTVAMLENDMKALALDPYISELYEQVAAVLRNRMPGIAASALQREKVLNPLFRELQPETEGHDLDVEIDEGNQRSLEHLWERIPEIHGNNGTPSVADSFINQTLAKLPVEPELSKALRLYGLGDYNEAAETAAKISKNGDWIIAYFLALSYERSAHYDEAEKVFEKRLLPYLTVPSVSLLAVKVESAIALKSLTDVVSKQPDAYISRLLLGKYHAAAHQDESALAEYQEALRIAPDQLGIHQAIGELYQNQMKWEAAAQEFRAELSKDSENAIAMAHLGHVLTELHDAKDAIPVLEQLLRGNPKDGVAYSDLGKAWEMEGESRNAIQAYESAIRYDPSQFNLHYRLSRLYQKQGEQVKAEKELTAFKAAEAVQQENARKAMNALR